MDEDVIDVSHLSEEEYKQHMRRLQQLHTVERQIKYT